MRGSSSNPVFPIGIGKKVKEWALKNPKLAAKYTQEQAKKEAQDASGKPLISVTHPPTS